MASPLRVLLIGPLQGARWRSISHYTATLESALQHHGVEVRVASAPWWNPPSVAAGLHNRWTAQPAIKAALRGEFDVIHLTDQALAHHVHRFAPHSPVIVTCHDLMAFTVPGYFHGRVEALVKRAFLRKPVGALKFADAVIAVSGYTASTIESLGAAPQGQVHIVPNIVRPIFRPMVPGEAESHLSASGISLPPRPRALSVGHAGGYKNLPLLISALAEDGARHIHLVRVGGLRRDQRQLARRLGAVDRITLLPGIDDATLAAVMNACDLLVQPSLAEGFGLPVAEAMACGLPVLVSDGGALPEVAGNAGMVLSGAGRSAGEMPAALASLISAAADKPGLREMGIARAASFTPEAVVPQLLDVYARARAHALARSAPAR